MTSAKDAEYVKQREMSLVQQEIQELKTYVDFKCATLEAHIKQAVGDAIARKTSMPSRDHTLEQIEAAAEEAGVRTENPRRGVSNFASVFPSQQSTGTKVSASQLSDMKEVLNQLLQQMDHNSSHAQLISQRELLAGLNCHTLILRKLVTINESIHQEWQETNRQCIDLDGQIGRSSGSPQGSEGTVRFRGCNITLGDTVEFSASSESHQSLEGVVRFRGSTHFADGEWLGVELNSPTGENDGSVEGFQYFTCSPKHGLFIHIGMAKPKQTLIHQF